MTAWQAPGSLRISGDAQSGSAFHLLPAVFCKLKNPCQAHRLRGGIMYGEALGATAKSVLHLQKTRSLRSTKSAEALQHFYFLLEMMCRGHVVFQPGVFCICRRTAALRNKKFAAILQHFPLGMMCCGRRVFQSRVFCIYRRPAAWKVPGKLRWNWMPPVRA